MGHSAKRPGQRLRIDELFAWVAVDENGDEGVMGMKTGHGWVPMVGADRERIESFRKYAMAVSAGSREKARLVKFTNRVDLEP
jgi:hypothetical protein